MTKFAPSGAHGRRLSFGDMLGTVKRAWTTKAGRRAPRPLEDIDGWSDQAEVAFYEDWRPLRCG